VVGADLIVPQHSGKRCREPHLHLAIATYALLLAAATFTINIGHPQNRLIAFLRFIQMEPAHILQYATLFVIGLLVGPRRWLETTPIRRGLTWPAVGGELGILM